MLLAPQLTNPAIYFHSRVQDHDNDDDQQPEQDDQQPDQDDQQQDDNKRQGQQQDAGPTTTTIALSIDVP